MLLDCLRAQQKRKWIWLPHPPTWLWISKITHARTYVRTLENLHYDFMCRIIWCSQQHMYMREHENQPAGAGTHNQHTLWFQLIFMLCLSASAPTNLTPRRKSTPHTFYQHQFVPHQPSVVSRHSSASPVVDSNVLMWAFNSLLLAAGTVSFLRRNF